MRLPLEPAGDLSPHVQNGLVAIANHGKQAAQGIASAVWERALYSRSSCAAGENSSACEKPVSGNTGTLAIALGAVIPLSCSVLALIYLHRRIKRKQRVEDANDPHKSLDFGSMPVGLSGRRKGKKGDIPEMTINHLDPLQHTRGLSMDMLGSPYMLPPGLHGSGESLRSMSRSIQDEHDPYRPVAFVGSPIDPTRSPRFAENGSVYSASTFTTTHNERANLVMNARPMSLSYPARGDSMNIERREDAAEPPILPSSNFAESFTPHESSSPPQDRTSLTEAGPPPPQKDTDIPLESMPPMPPTPEDPPFTPPPRTSSARKEVPSNAEANRRLSESSLYDGIVPLPERDYSGSPYPEIHEPEDDGYDIDPSMIQTGRFSIDTPQPSQQYPVQAENRVSIMGLRPLPPENPEENAEQRANRIRSFYREYFDDSKPNPEGQYEEEWDGDFFDGAIYDPDSGAYFFAGDRPFAQPPGRRAMTPPPAGARFGPGAHGRHFSTMSGGRRPPGRPGPPPRKPQKKLPPPKPLLSLPTPHMLKEDNMVLSPIDFAPPSTFRDTQNGRRPDSPMGVQRPFSPRVRVYSPLVPASNELSVMPSPHHLRKSGTFTGLDFAKLPRFRGQEGAASDAGSIRSARSGISAMQVDAVRAGAYRVSRIPKEMVTTKDDIAAQLRPKMNLISPA